jgi:PPP family 3-phenylpropionic acid transporter
VIRWEAAGISPRTASVLWSESVAAEIAVFVVAGPRVLDRFGPVFAMTVAALAGILRWSVMACTADVTAMALAEPLHGLSFALLHLACMRLIGRLVPANLAATAQAIYGTVAIGATTAMVTLLSGTLYGRFGASGFWVMATLCASALPFIAVLSRTTSGEKLAPAA